jgi:hypothetical protein
MYCMLPFLKDMKFRPVYSKGTMWPTMYLGDYKWDAGAHSVKVWGHLHPDGATSSNSRRDRDREEEGFENYA